MRRKRVDIIKTPIKPLIRELKENWYFDEEGNLCKRKETPKKEDFLKEDEFRM